MNTYVILDLETTGLSAENDRITEVAALKIREDGTEVGSFHTMIKLPGRQKIPPFITELTGITDADLIGGMQQRDAMKALDRFCRGSIVVAQNAPFDLEFIFRKGKIQPGEFICTRALSKLVDPAARSHSLKNICERLGVDLSGHHRAMNDVQATKECFFKLKQLADEKGVYYPNTVIDFPDRPLKWKPAFANVIKVFKA